MPASLPCPTTHRHTDTRSPCRFLVDGRFVDSLNCLLSGWFFSLCLSLVWNNSDTPRGLAWLDLLLFFFFFLICLPKPVAYSKFILGSFFVGFIIDNGLEWSGVGVGVGVGGGGGKGPKTHGMKRAKRKTRIPKKSFQNKLCKRHHIWHINSSSSSVACVYGKNLLHSLIPQKNCPLV